MVGETVPLIPSTSIRVSGDTFKFVPQGSSCLAPAGGGSSEQVADYAALNSLQFTIAGVYSLCVNFTGVALLEYPSTTVTALEVSSLAPSFIISDGQAQTVTFTGVGVSSRDSAWLVPSNTSTDAQCSTYFNASAISAPRSVTQLSPSKATMLVASTTGFSGMRLCYSFFGQAPVLLAPSVTLSARQVGVGAPLTHPL